MHQSFQTGFIKRAQYYGFNHVQATRLLKLANSLTPADPHGGAPQDDHGGMLHDLEHNVVIPADVARTTAELAPGVARGASNVAGRVSSFGRVAGGLGRLAEGAHHIAESPVMKGFNKFFTPAAAGLEAYNMYGHGQGQQSVNEAANMVKTQSPGQALWRAAFNPVKTLSGLGGVASDMYRGVNDVNQTNTRTAQNLATSSALNQQNQQRVVRENQAVASSPAYAQNNPSNLSVDKWRQQANNGGDWNVTGNKVHYTQNLHGQSSANNAMLAQRNQLPREGNIAVNNTLTPNVASRPVPNPGTAPKPLLANKPPAAVPRI